jgi:C4-dicarboxylate transporter, DctM subunit
MISPLMACMIGIVVFLVLLVLGLPIFVTMGAGAIVGIILSGNFPLLANFSIIAFDSGYGWSFVAVPLFVFMGFLVVHHKLGESLFTTVYRWIGFVPGGLGISAALFSALFGFVCGSGTAGVVTVGGVCLPEMLKRKYNLRLALGTLATTGGLAALIPPSVLMILYCVLTEASLGKLFLAGIIPGFVLTGMISLYIIIRATLNPALAPPGEAFSWKDRIRSLGGIVPVAVIFICVIGGLYFGLWTPIEAGGVATAAALIVSLIYSHVSWKTIQIAAMDTVKVFGMLYMLQISANLFSFLFYVSGTSDLIARYTLSLHLPGWAIIIFMWMVMFILGGPLEPPAILMICTPIFSPLVTALGYDLIWFGIFMVLACEVATLSPPVGMSIFAILRVAPEGTTLRDVNMGILPFMGIISLLIVLITVFPQIVLWLPGKLM